jgi:multidrug efflux pump subunit AcrB
MTSRGRAAERDIIEKADNELWATMLLNRERSILMTTATAILGSVPLVLSFGTGSEIRGPLGIAIIGGLIVSQLLTLYTTPVIYLYLERLSDSSLRASQGMMRLLNQFGVPSS